MIYWPKWRISYWQQWRQWIANGAIGANEAMAELATMATVMLLLTQTLTLIIGTNNATVTTGHHWITIIAIVTIVAFVTIDTIVIIVANGDSGRDIVI